MQNDSDPCSIIIKGTASSNIVVNRWNSRPPEQRKSREMRKYIRDSGYIDWVSQRMKMWPLNDRPAFNALGIASRYHRRRYYPMLLEALEEAEAGRKKKKTLPQNFREYPEFMHPDGDYDDFQRWEKEQARKKK
jgi:hypothetical protein